MEFFKIILFSSLPALLYAFIIYITVPYKTINIKTGLFYLLGGFLSVGLLLYFFEFYPQWGRFASDMVDKFKYPMHYVHIKNFVQIALVEELAKLGIFFVITNYRASNGKNNDHPLGTMFYVGMVSLGFAIVENVMYGVRSPFPLDTIMWRSFTAVIGHMVFGMFMGYWIAMGKLKPRLNNRSIFDIVVLKANKFKKGLFVIIGLLCATILHGVYDLHIELYGQVSISTLYMLLIMSVMGVAWCFKNVYKLSSKKVEP